MKKVIYIIFYMIYITPAQGQDYDLTLEPYVFETSDGRTVDAELGSFLVPENRAKKESRMLRLKFVRFKSTSSTPGNPIIYLAGGPGGSGIGTARGTRFDLFMKMRAVADVIAFDQRGTGESEGLPNYMGTWNIDFTEVLTAEKVSSPITEEVDKMVAYFEENGSDIEGYTSRESAHDMDDLRAAINAEKLNVWGISYGTHLGLTYLKQYEDKVDRMILAGLEGYNHTVKMPRDQQELLEAIDSLIKKDPEASKAYPDFLGDMAAVLESVDKNPVVIETVSPFDGSVVKVTIGKLSLQQLFSWYLGGPDIFKDLPYHVSLMKNGDFSGIKEYALYTHLGRLNGMSTAMDAASGLTQERRLKIKEQAEHTLLGDAINFPYLIVHDALPQLDLGDEFREPFTSDVPVLCISGTLDGRTAVNNADETLKTLRKGVHLIIEGAGHSDPLFLSSPRIGEVMAEFASGKKVEHERIKLPPMKFKLPTDQ